MVKVTATRENLINCLLEDIPLEEIMERHGMTLKQINQLRKNKDFEKELRERRKIALYETQNLAHIYILEGQKALYQVMMTTKDERIKMEAARFLLKEVRDNLDVLETFKERDKIDKELEELKKLEQLKLGISTDDE
jgi:hypothetical protein